MAKKCCVLILAATIVAFILRLPRLQQRPMHGDEAVHAIKFGQLLEEGAYTYNPDEYHGPTLNYLTLIPARLASATKLTQVTEFILRIVPLVFGVLLVLMLLLAADGLAPGAAIYAAILTAISPAMVFYSRYYIQEMLLVCFTFGAITCAYRYTRNKNHLWAILTGIFLALMHATKETCIIAFGSMFLALLLMLLMWRPKGSLASAAKKVQRSHLIAGLAAAVIVSALFYSSFLANPGGIFDSFRAYGAYFDRAGNNTLHIHPWYYYLKMLMYSRYGDGPMWTEALIVLLAVVGFIAVMTKKGLSSANVHLLRFIAFYTLVLTVVYSAVPYKTPWCMLGFLHGMILLAGVGAVVLVRLAPNVLPRLIVIFLVFEASLVLTWQAYLGSYKFCADSRNPYVYAHPTPEVFTIVQRVEDIARVHEDGNRMQIQVICPEDDYWPLPWYFRFFSKVQWQNEVADNASSAPLIIASDKVQEALTNKLYTLVMLMGFVRKDLWDRYQQHQAESIQLQKTGEK
ncbi:MAG: flippase activity-associated protein Agl23 [Planctomycetota bacterium]|jgi:uncharacterized protein (TIGR03663 family)